MSAGNRAVVSVIGRDQKGVVARVSTYLAVLQHQHRGHRAARDGGPLHHDDAGRPLRADAPRSTSWSLGLRQIGDEIDMEVTLRLAGGPPSASASPCWSPRSRTACEQLVRDRDAGSLERRPRGRARRTTRTCEPLAREHGIPFAWAPSTDKAAHEDFLLAQLAE